MKKNILCTLLCVVICLGVFAAPASADGTRDTSFEESVALNLKQMGLFKGTSSTGANFELNRPASRVEAIVMLIRVLGKEEEALAGNWSHPFTDVASWADPYIGYAYENGLTNGSGASTFGTGNATSSMYLTFMLRSLGYSDTNGADFTWDNPYSLAKNAGILPSVVDTTDFLRADVALVCYSALNSNLKGGNQTLAQKLIGAGTFTKAQFDRSYDSGLIAAYEKEAAKNAPLKYDIIWTDTSYRWYRPFANGISIVQNEDSGYGLVNSKGEEILQPAKHNQRVSISEDGLAFVSQYFGAFDDKQFYIDENGKIVIDPEKLGYCLAQPFYDGLARVTKGKSILSNTVTCYIDKTGREVINLGKSCTASDFSEGHAFISDGSGVKIIDKTGRVTGTLPKNFDFTNGVSEFHEGFAIVFDRYDENGIIKEDGDNYYFTDIHGNILNKTGYEVAFSFSEGLAPVMKDGKSGYIDTSGNLAIPLVWDGGGRIYDENIYHIRIITGSSFNGGYALAPLNGKRVFIDKTGAIVSDKKDFMYYDELENGYWSVSDESGHVWGVINAKGEEIIPIEYGCIYYSDGLVLASKLGKYGYLNMSGKVVIPFQFDDATIISDGLAWVKQNGKWGILHLETES